MPFLTPSASQFLTPNSNQWMMPFNWQTPTTNQWQRPELLDYINKPSMAAYGLRLLMNRYRGKPLIRVRRSSDSAEMNISHLLNGDLNISELETFLNGSDGFISAWYRQNSSEKNLIQTSIASQPQIAIAGQVIKVNNRPSVYCNAKHLSATSFSYNQLTAFCVWKYSATNQGLFQFGDLNTSGSLFTETAGITARITTGGIQITVPNAINKLMQTTSSYDSSLITLNRDLSVSNSYAHSYSFTNSSKILLIGKLATLGTYALNGYVSELIFFDTTALTDAEKQFIARNQMAYYNIAA